MSDRPESVPDHRRIGRDLRLFDFSPNAPAQAFWEPDGVAVLNRLLSAWRALNAARGYLEVRTPLIYDSGLWRRSGHWDKYRDEMFVCPDGERDLGVKPMNCPGHIELYRMRRRSHRELPLRFAEAGLVHRNERSGAVNGLLRTRGFVIDDAHLFCSRAQLASELDGCLALAGDVYGMFGLAPRVELSTRPERRIGSDGLWDDAEDALARALQRHGFEHSVSPGEGAFYGPKIDFHLPDGMGRSWQMGTLQIDFAMPERFGLSYADADGSAAVPVIVHAAVMGSFERFLAVLLEHCDGRLPAWLCPVQVVVIPVADRQAAAAAGLAAELVRAGLRARAGDAQGPLAGRVRQAARRRAPFVLVVGDRELEGGRLAVRERGEASWEADRPAAVERIAAACRAPIPPEQVIPM